jgi:hypothetical protein
LETDHLDQSVAAEEARHVPVVMLFVVVDLDAFFFVLEQIVDALCFQEL